MLITQLKSSLHRVIDIEDLWQNLITTIYEREKIKTNYLSCAGILIIFM